MVKQLLSVSALCLLVACGNSSNPFMDDETDDGDPAGENGGETDGDTGGPIESDGRLPPGTTDPTPDTSIYRSEARVTDANDSNYGNGFANDIFYDGENDTFYVDGLAFDGTQPDGVAYSRAAGKLGSHAAYEAPTFVPDDVTGTPIRQFTHRAVYGVSPSGVSEFAVVRTGNYANYGFGGFIYQRNQLEDDPTADDLVLPPERPEGQATYSGDYAGLRDFQGRGGLELVRAQAEIDIDIGAFEGSCTGTNCEHAIRGYIFDREILDLNGNDISADYLAALNDDLPDGTPPAPEIPTITFRVGPGVMDENGEATGGVDTVDPEGNELDTGNYYLLLSGDHTTGDGEIAGIVVIEGDDPRFDNVTVRETGGFIATR